jgi:hypothetical protein
LQEDVLAKVGQLSAELKEAQDKLSNPATSGKSEVIFRAEIDSLKRSLWVDIAWSQWCLVTDDLYLSSMPTAR